MISARDMPPFRRIRNRVRTAGEPCFLSLGPQLAFRAPPEVAHFSSLPQYGLLLNATTGKKESGYRLRLTTENS